MKIMSDFPSQHHKQLLKESRVDSDSNRPIKRRKRALPEVASRAFDTGMSNAFQESDNSTDFEDVDLDGAHQEGWESDNSDDFEKVSFDIDDIPSGSNLQPNLESDQVMTFKLDTTQRETQSKRKVQFISKEERTRRVLIHKIYIVLMLIHVAIRNSWCSNKSISKSLKQACVTRQITQLLNDDSGKDNVKSRRLLDGIRKLMEIYASKFRITSQGLLRKTWNELSIVQDSDVVTRKKFAMMVTNFRGSRDIAAQGFATLLRGLGLNARLVVSLQPPDFTIITENISSKRIQKAKEKTTDPSEIISTRLHKSKTNFEDSDYPVFWVEVWDKFAKHWISVDPIVKKRIEICSKRRPSPFEPPSSDERNQLLYVVAFDKYGRVRDVTRRYSINYNARVIRKRIEFKSDEEKEWYESVLKSCQKTQSRSVTDILEAKEFHERDLAEGMPNNIQAFKNHPLYALESQLRQNEEIYPKDDTSVCGTFRPKNALGKLLPVYRRSCVQKLKSARAWYMKGRVLKISVSSLKSKQKSGNDEGEEDTRLYAEFQTKLYIPPKIENGKVPKNQYGNIDVYTDTMIPENGVLIKIGGPRTIKMLQKAATLLGIDYAKAITSFDFTQKGKGMPIAKEGGIVIHKDNRDALELTLDHMIQEDEEERRVMDEMNALQNWKYFLLKLRLKQRLNRTHGIVKDENLTQEHFMDDNTNRSVLDSGHNVADGSDDDFGGGFIVSDTEVGELIQDEGSNSAPGFGDTEVTTEHRSKNNPAYKELSDSDVEDEDADVLPTKSRRRVEYSSCSSGSEFKADDDDESLEFEYESD